MHWIWWMLATVLAVAGLMAVVGALLPLRHKVTRRARLRASPAAVYAVLAGSPDWRTGVRSFGVLPEADGRKRWWEEDTHGHKIVFELVEDVPPTRLRTRIAQPGLPFGGAWTFELAPADGGCEVQITEDGEIYNVIFRFLARFVFGYSATLETYLGDLGARFQRPEPGGPGLQPHR